MWMWGVLLQASAVEGISNIYGPSTTVISSENPWNLEVSHQFWLKPVVSINGEWFEPTVSDVLLQRFSIDYQIQDSWSTHIEIPMIFVGSKELYRRGNIRLGMHYHQSFAQWKSMLGIDLVSAGVGSTLISWSNRGLYPNVHAQRNGGRWIVDVDAGVFWIEGLYPTGSLLVQRNRNQRFPIGVGIEGMVLENEYWTASSIQVSRQLEAISFVAMYRTPLRLDVLFEGSLVEFRVDYTPKTIRRDTDRDQDGIGNLEDFCTDEPEDVDGFEDEDGCPDFDNDLDGILDELDQCPIFAEDVDGFEDEDGCPDLDNDEDNILDSVDRCPSQPETVNQYQDTDGCPDAQSQPDFDNDGLWDDRDNCPFDPEDIDGVQDEDGCPDPDEMPIWLERLKMNETNETNDP